MGGQIEKTGYKRFSACPVIPAFAGIYQVKQIFIAMERRECRQIVSESFYISVVPQTLFSVVLFCLERNGLLAKNVDSHIILWATVYIFCKGDMFKLKYPYV